MVCKCAHSNRLYVEVRSRSYPTDLLSLFMVQMQLISREETPLGHKLAQTNASVFDTNHRHAQTSLAFRLSIRVSEASENLFKGRRMIRKAMGTVQATLPFPLS